MSSALSIPPWHADLWAHMMRAMASDRVAHGLLICGAPGVGKRAFAHRVVAALLCRARRDDGDACGSCVACRQYAAETHPDISRLLPEDTGRLIKVDQVRAFGHALHLTSQYSSGRIGWIDPAEQLSISATNSLLKTLEEPPSSCHIVLVSDRVSALMATIRSRCQLWRVPPAEPEAGARWLADNGIEARTADPDSLRSPFAIIARQDQNYDDLVRGWDDDLLRLLNRRANAVVVAERAAGAAPDLWVDWVFRRANGLLAVSLGDPADNGLSEPLQGAARRIGPRVCQRWALRVMDVARLRRTNADWRLVLESLFLDLAEQVAGERTV